MNKDTQSIFNSYRLIVEAQQPTKEQQQAVQTMLKAYGFDTKNTEPIAQQLATAKRTGNLNITTPLQPGTAQPGVKYFFLGRELTPQQVSRLGPYAKPYMFNPEKKQYAPVAINPQTNQYEFVPQAAADTGQQQAQTSGTQQTQQQAQQPAIQSVSSSELQGQTLGGGQPASQGAPEFSAPQRNMGGGVVGGGVQMAQRAAETKPGPERRFVDLEQGHTEKNPMGRASMTAAEYTKPDNFNKPMATSEDLFNIFKSAFGR